LLIDATLIMAGPMSPEVHGCAEHARRSR
jgi:hypothetical protein